MTELRDLVSNGRLEYTIPGRPITKKNSMQIAYNRTTGRMFVRPSKAFEQYQEEAGWFLRGPTMRAMLAGRYNVKCVYYMPTRHKVDLGNLLAGTCDILVHFGVLADDNSNIVAAHDGSRVRYDKENPRVEITITELED